MVENRPILNIVSHIILILGIAIVALPIWITFVAATHDAVRMTQAPIPLLPGSHSVTQLLLLGNHSVAQPLSTMGSVVMCLYLTRDRTPFPGCSLRTTIGVRWGIGRAVVHCLP